MGRLFDEIPIKIDGLQFERVSSAKVLGVMISNNLKWNDHVDPITSKAARQLYLLSQLKGAGRSPNDLLALYCSVIRSDCARILMPALPPVVFQNICLMMLNFFRCLPCE